MMAAPLTGSKVTGTDAEESVFDPFLRSLSFCSRMDIKSKCVELRECIRKSKASLNKATRFEILKGFRRANKVTLLECLYLLYLELLPRGCTNPRRMRLDIKQLRSEMLSLACELLRAGAQSISPAREADLEGLVSGGRTWFATIVDPKLERIPFVDGELLRKLEILNKVPGLDIREFELPPKIEGWTERMFCCSEDHDDEIRLLGCCANLLAKNHKAFAEMGQFNQHRFVGHLPATWREKLLSMVPEDVVEAALVTAAKARKESKETARRIHVLSPIYERMSAQDAAARQALQKAFNKLKKPVATTAVVTTVLGGRGKGVVANAGPAAAAFAQPQQEADSVDAPDVPTVTDDDARQALDMVPELNAKYFCVLV